MFAQLGSIKFEGLRSLDTLSDKIGTNYAEHALIEGKPRLQRVGTNLREFQATGLLHAAFCNPEAEYDALDKARQDAEVLPLVYGNGFYEGDFVITEISRTPENTDAQGNYIALRVSMTLKEFVDPNKLITRQYRAKRNAFAVAEQRPLPANPTPPVQNPAVATSNNVQESDKNVNFLLSLVLQINTTVNNITSGIIDQAQKFVDVVAYERERLLSYWDVVDAKLIEIESLYLQYPTLYTVAPDLRTQIDAIQAQSATSRATINGYTSLPNPVSTTLQAQICLDALADTVTQTQAAKDALTLLKSYNQPIALHIALKKPL